MSFRTGDMVRVVANGIFYNHFGKVETTHDSHKFRTYVKLLCGRIAWSDEPEEDFEKVSKEEFKTAELLDL